MYLSSPGLRNNQLISTTNSSHCACVIEEHDSSNLARELPGDGAKLSVGESQSRTVRSVNYHYVSRLQLKVKAIITPKQFWKQNCIMSQ